MLRIFGLEVVVLFVGMRRTYLHGTQEWSHDSQLFVADEFASYCGFKPFTCYEDEKYDKNL